MTSNKLSVNSMCISIRNGAEIWIEEDRAGNLITLLEQKKDKGFLSVDGQFVNVADIVGIFSAETMEQATHRKNGQWKDEEGIWRNKGEWKCDYDKWHMGGDFCKCLNRLGYREN